MKRQNRQAARFQPRLRYGATIRELADDIVIQPGTDVSGAWDRFEVFEALHHGMRICNPMLSDDLDELVDLVAPVDEDCMLDIACGHGELLVRAAERARVCGVGIDLSPWAIVNAHRRGSAASLVGTVEWRLGDAHALAADERFDIVTCLGASWIWHGFKGTAAAVVKRTLPGGRIAIGDLRLRDGADPDGVAEVYGRVLTTDDQLEILGGLGVDVMHRHDAGDDGWDAYQSRVLNSVEEWARRNPGESADRYLSEQHQWRADYLADWQFLEWSVWVGTCA